MAGESIVLKEKKRKMPEHKELITRVMSSFMFIPVIVFLYFASIKILSLLAVFVVAIMAYEIFSPKIKGHIKFRSAMFAFCTLGVGCFMYCRSVYGVSGCIFLVCIASFTDIGAYCVGKALKGPKLCPKISPNKTWAGFWGGIFLANIACYCLNSLFSQISEQSATLPPNATNFFVIQCLILASVCGDLIESWFKRKIGVKDMGHLFPGHGGVLDRLDSLIGASVFLFMIHFFI